LNSTSKTTQVENQKRVYHAGTLAVGTEVTDGQILDRNSAWISQKLTGLGVQILEHRAVPDDRELIAKALGDLRSSCDLLFVTGGLGPTSDDFTREILAEEFSLLPLQFDQGSWQHVQDTLRSRGVQVSKSQEKQCYFPQNVKVLTNRAGTANAFCFQADELQVFALPGPPSEIAMVWKESIAAMLEQIVPQSEREKLLIWRCLGKAEADLADLTEEIFAGTGLRLGYRAHMPYVEIKVWVKASDVALHQDRFKQLEKQIAPWLVNRDHQDLAEDFFKSLDTKAPLKVYDHATRGILAERLTERLNAKKNENTNEKLEPAQVQIISGFSEAGLESVGATEAWQADIVAQNSPQILALALSADAKTWILGAKTSQMPLTWVNVPPPYSYDLRAERARRYVSEKCLQIFLQLLS
jgi:nicotinamide-nucleotide amidase